MVAYGRGGGQGCDASASMPSGEVEVGVRREGAGEGRAGAQVAREPLVRIGHAVGRGGRLPSPSGLVDGDVWPLALERDDGKLLAAPWFVGWRRLGGWDVGEEMFVDAFAKRC